MRGIANYRLYEREKTCSFASRELPSIMLLKLILKFDRNSHYHLEYYTVCQTNKKSGLNREFPILILFSKIFQNGRLTFEMFVAWQRINNREIDVK